MLLSIHLGQMMETKRVLTSAGLPKSFFHTLTKKNRRVTVKNNASVYMTSNPSQVLLRCCSTMIIDLSISCTYIVFFTFHNISKRLNHLRCRLTEAKPACPFHCWRFLSKIMILPQKCVNECHAVLQICFIQPPRY